MNINLIENKYNFEEINSSLTKMSRKINELENSVSLLEDNVRFILIQQVNNLKRAYTIESIMLFVIEIMLLATVMYVVATLLFKDKLWFLHADKYNTIPVCVVFMIISIMLFIKTIFDIKDVYESNIDQIALGEFNRPRDKRH